MLSKLTETTFLLSRLKFISSESMAAAKEKSLLYIVFLSCNGILQPTSSHPL